MLPKYLVRPSDFAIYSINDDGLTYSHMIYKNKIENYVGNCFKYETLISSGFFVITDNELTEYQNRYEMYYDEYNKSVVNDGHGGLKLTDFYLSGKSKYFKLMPE